MQEEKYSNSKIEPHLETNSVALMGQVDEKPEVKNLVAPSFKQENILHIIFA